MGVARWRKRKEGRRLENAKNGTRIGRQNGTKKWIIKRESVKEDVKSLIEPKMKKLRENQERKRQNPVILRKKEYLRKRKGGTAEMKSLARDHLMSGKAKNTKEKRSRTPLMNQIVKKSIQRKRKQRNQKLIQKVKVSLKKMKSPKR